MPEGTEQGAMQIAPFLLPVLFTLFPAVASGRYQPSAWACSHWPKPMRVTGHCAAWGMGMGA